MQMTSFIIGFYSSGSPARGVIASALLQTMLADRFGSSIPIEGLPIVESRSMDSDKVIGRVLEALSKEGVDVPAVRVALRGEEDVDLYVAFTAEEADAISGKSVLLLHELAGDDEGGELVDTLGDFGPLVRRIKDLVDRALPKVLLLARHKHLKPSMELIGRLLEGYKLMDREMDEVATPEGFSRLASMAGTLEDGLFELIGARSPAKRYAEAYGNVCLCGGTMQLISEKLSKGVYELTFVCNRCGRKIVRYQ